MFSIRTCRLALAPIMVLALALGLTRNTTMAEDAPAKPTLYATAFHADWCGGCKKLGPKVMSIMPDLQAKGVELVKFDLTNDETTAASEKTAAKMGLDKVFSEHKKKTGYVLLINPHNGQILGRLTPGQDKDEMMKTVQAAADKAKA
jgi:thiol-disulfide isomerase/thioredoxin